MDVLIVVSIVFYAGVLISFRSTVKKHPYIAYATAGYIAAWFLPGGLTLLGLIFLAALGSATWASYDIHKLQVYKYRLSGPTRSLMAGLGFCLLWIVGAWPFWIVFLTWHLANRHMILDGIARVKPKYKKSPPMNSKKSPAANLNPLPAQSSSPSGVHDSGKVKIMDVAVEDVEVAEVEDESAHFTSPDQPASDAGRAPEAPRQPQRKRLTMAKWGAIGLGGLIVIFVAVPLITTSPSTNNGNYGGNYGGEQHYSSGSISPDATHRFWEDANSIIRAWWELTSRVTNQSGNQNDKFLLNLLMLEQTINAINHLSIQNVDSQAVQAVAQIRNCMSRYLQLGIDANECRRRYGTNYPQHETARLLTALALCGAETITVKDDYTQTARRLSRTYGKRFSGS